MTENEKINGWTFEETIKTAEALMETEKNMFNWDVLRHLRDFAETFLEEVQQYRAIGTPEELQDMKNNYFEALSDWRQYRKIGTLEECRAAMKKQKPMTVVEKTILPHIGGSVGSCPKCLGRPLREYDNPYCPECGQKLDWYWENEE